MQNEGQIRPATSALWGCHRQHAGGPALVGLHIETVQPGLGTQVYDLKSTLLPATDCSTGDQRVLGA